MKQKNSWFVILASLAGLCFSTASSASIISVTGSGQILNYTPADVSEGVVEGDIVYGFDEDQHVYLDSGIAADYDESDGDGSTLTGSNGVSSSLTATGWLSAGLYDSHLITFDPNVASPGASSIESVSFTFSGNIVAIFLSAERLWATDDLFNSITDTYYSTGVDFGRRAEFPDLISFTGNTLTIEYLITNWKYTDQIRVITQVPAPAPVAMLLMVMSAMIVVRKVKKSA